MRLEPFAPPTETSETRFGRVYASSGRRLGRRLVDQLAIADELEPRLTPARVGAYVVAVLVALMALALFALGVRFFVAATTTLFAIPFGALFCGIAVMMRPRLGKVPIDGVVRRIDAPTLYGLLEQIADALGTRRVDLVTVDDEWNASWSVLGLRRKRVVSVGLPLLAALARQERVSVLAHELAHARNGDSQRGLVVGSSLRGLAEFYSAIAPDPDHGAFDVPSWMMWLLSRPIYGLLLLQWHLANRDSQRAEF